MKFYQELTILPDPEISKYFIWQKLYTQLHLALVEHAKAMHGDTATHGDIGVSFPEYAFEKQVNNKRVTTLGHKIRIFADSEESLESLDMHKWLERLTDYVHIKSVQAVPIEHGFVTVSRARQIKNLDQVARRRQKHQGISFDEAKANIITRYADEHKISHEEAVKAYENPRLQAYPYVTTKSLSGKQGYPLEITQNQASQAVQGKFGTYGLSAKSTTVPHWEKL